MSIKIFNDENNSDTYLMANQYMKSAYEWNVYYIYTIILSLIFLLIYFIRKTNNFIVYVYIFLIEIKTYYLPNG